MPIDRPDGRHWCDPASETAGEDGTWTCPCGKVWRRHENAIWGLDGEPTPVSPGRAEIAAQGPQDERTEGDEL